MNILKYSGLLFLIFVFIVLFAFISTLSTNFYIKAHEFEQEGFLAMTPGQYPEADDKPLLTDTYPFIGKNTVSDSSSYDHWWHYPIFSLGSYAQITNNLRYRRNPDDGTCIRPGFCGALYKSIKNKTNISQPLPPVPNGCGQTRVNYYNTPYNLSPGTGYQG